ncbi:mCG144466, partial [Mus musculus]
LKRQQESPVIPNALLKGKVRKQHPSLRGKRNLMPKKWFSLESRRGKGFQRERELHKRVKNNEDFMKSYLKCLWCQRSVCLQRKIEPLTKQASR